METQLTHLFDTLNLNEANQLLEKDIAMKVEEQTLSRIKALTFQKIKGKKKQFFVAHFRNLRAAAVAVFVFTAIGGGTGYAYYKAPVAYLDIDINPSIELGINRWDRIVSAKGYNSDGQNVLKAKNILNKKAEEGVKVIMETANDQGFLSGPEGATVAVTSLTDDSDKAEALTDVSKDVIEQYTEEEALDVEIVIEHIALKRIEEAKELGISPGKLNLIQKLQALDDTITAEEYKDATVKEIMKTAIALKKEQKLIQKQEKVERSEENNASDENEDEDRDGESLEIKEDSTEEQLEGPGNSDQRNAKRTSEQVKTNSNSGKKQISTETIKEDTNQDIKEGTDQDPQEDTNQGAEKDIVQDTKQDSKQDNKKNIEQENKRSNKTDVEQERANNTKKTKN